MITLTYKKVSGMDLQIDVYAPCMSPRDGEEGSPTRSAPAIVFFHGGGLTVGNRTSWFPFWMQRRFTEKGYLFISADYRLTPPSTGHDIVQDIRDLWAFINDPALNFEFTAPIGSSECASREGTKVTVKIQPGAVAATGVSAGGLCAYLAAMHCHDPPPRAVLSLYGMGGDFLTPHYLTPKTQPFFRGRELLTPSDPPLRPFVFPYPPSPHQPLLPTSDSPLSYSPLDHPTKPGYPSNPRMLLARLYLQMGVYLDYYTGEHEPSLSERLRGAVDLQSELGSEDEITKVIGARHLGLFPQFSLGEGTDKEWPPTALIHGTEDTAVPIHESRHLYDLLRSSRPRRGEEGSSAEDLLIEIPGAEHSFDLAPGAEEKHSAVFERVVEFVHRAVVGGKGGTSSG